MPIDYFGPTNQALADSGKVAAYKNTLARQNRNEQRQNRLLDIKERQFAQTSQASDIKNKLEQISFVGKLAKAVEASPETERETAFQWAKEQFENIYGPTDTIPERYDQGWVKNIINTVGQAEQKLYETEQGWLPRDRAIGLQKPTTTGTEMQTIYGPNNQTMRVPITKGQEYAPPAGWTLQKPGQGMEIESTPDGGFTFRQGSGVGGGMQRSTKTALEKKIIGADDQLAVLDKMINDFDSEYLKKPKRLEMAYNNLAEAWDFKSLSPEQKQELADYSDYGRNAIEAINMYIKEITGAQMSEKEANRLRLAMPDFGENWFKGDGPTKFEAKLKGAHEKIKMARARYSYSLKKGLEYDDISLDRMPAIINKFANSQGELLEKRGIPEQEIRAHISQAIMDEFGVQM